jgi:hypothetical protein
MKARPLVLGALAAASILAGAARAAVLETYAFTDFPLPLTPHDGNPVGISDTRTIDSSIISIEDVNVTISLVNSSQGGAFNGDYFVSLSHESGYAVLLNRVGVRPGDGPAAVGYSDNGFNVTLDDQALAGDIHVYRFTLFGSHTVPIDPEAREPLTGTWAPDGRHPLDGPPFPDTPRNALLSSFNGLPASGDWTLFVADLNGTATATLTGWGLEITGAAIPEPEHAAIAILLGLAAWAGARRWKRNA